MTHPRSNSRRADSKPSLRFSQESILPILFAFLLSAFTMTPIHAQSALVPCFGKFEASFTLPDTMGNPFDPAENDVWVTFSGPNGLIARTPAFWDGIWKVRFAPTAAGHYTFTVTRNGKTEMPGSLASQSFTCVPSNDPGFLRRDPQHVQRFLFDNGQPYYPLGMDVAWSGGGLPDYPGYMEKMQASGMNWARVWMTFWDGKALDWAPNRSQSPPFGHYLLDAAQQWDVIFDAAALSGVYVQMTLQHHGQVTRVVDSNWRDNPMNIQNPGGFLKEPQDFFTDPRAIALTRAKYRYIVARWGYSDHLMGWEIFNEIQNNPEVKPHMDQVIAWHKQMVDYIRSLDPNHHLVTTSYTPCGDPLEVGSGIDYLQPHAYVPDIIAYLGAQDLSHCTKPIFFGEFGAAGRQTQQFAHDGIWAGMMNIFAGAPQFWFWDLVQRDDYWDLFANASGYVSASGFPSNPGLVVLHPAIRTTARGDLSFAPALGWGATTNFVVNIDPENGEIQGLGDVSSFIHGSAHREMTRQPVVFNVNYLRPGQFQLVLGTIARSGAHPQILLDGKVATEKSFAPDDQDYPADATLSIDVPSGQHQIGLFNTGSDWFTVQQIRLTGYAPALASATKGDDRHVFFWAYRRKSVSSGLDEPVSGFLSFTGLAEGLYHVHLWDTTAGVGTGQELEIYSSSGTLDIPIDNLQTDIAGWAERTT